MSCFEVANGSLVGGHLLLTPRDRPPNDSTGAPAREINKPMRVAPVCASELAATGPRGERPSEQLNQTTKTSVPGV